LHHDRKYDNEYERKRWVIQKLWDMGDKGLLLPRWRGVLLTSDAELETIVAMDRMQRNRRVVTVGRIIQHHRFCRG
jgi:hypothetical protein